MRGYEKIQYACEQAKRDGLNYVWVDTCCIRNVTPTDNSVQKCVHLPPDGSQYLALETNLFLSVPFLTNSFSHR